MPFLKTQGSTLALLCGLFLLAANVVQAQYMEQFNTAGRGYLINCANNFTGVPWTLTAWDPAGSCRISPPDAVTDLRDPDDYFHTTGGVLTGIDFDQELCWISPTITVPTSGVGFSVKIGWTQFDRESVSNVASDYIDVEYSTNGGANWTRLPTLVGLGLSGHTVCYRNDDGSGNNTGPTNQNNPTSPGLNTFGASGIAGGGTLIIRICAQFNQTGETITIDDVSVPLGSVGGCTAPTLSTSVTNVSCNGGSTGTINLTVSGGGTPPYTYAWTGGAATEDLMNLAVGTYTVTVTDNLMCSATTSATIGVAPAITRSTVVGDATCAAVADGGVDLTVSGGVPPYTYSWSTFADVTQDIDNVSPGTYTVTITDAPGCTSTISATVGVAAPGPYNETFAVDGKGYLPNFVDNFVGVSWSIDPWPVTDINIIGREADDYFRTSGGGLVGVDLDQNICWVSPVIDINPPGSGVNFTVDLSWTSLDREDESNNASDFIDVEYSVDGGAWTQVPTTSPATGLSGHTICYRNNNGGGPSSAPTDNNGSLVLTVPGISGSTLRIRVCSQFNSEDESITINSVSVSAGTGVYCPAPESEAGAAQMFCDGQEATLAATATNGTGAWSVVSGPSTANTQFSSTSAANATFTPSGGAGTYTLRWTVSANGFSDATDDVVITVKAKPTAPITPNPSPVCQNATLNLSVPDAGVGATYFWSGSGIVNTNANSTTAVPSATGSQPYAVTVTGANACSTVGSINVTVNARPSATITFGTPACDGGTLNLSVPNAGVGAAYNWSGPGVVNNNSASTTAALSGTGSMTYFVTVTGANGCISTSSNSVTVNPVPSATISTSTPVCLNASFNLSVPNAGGGASYSWSGLGVNNTNAASTTATPNATGSQSYFVTVTTAAGCSATSSTSVTVNALPDATITGGGVYCGGTTVSLSAPAGGTTYSWGRFDGVQVSPGFPIVGSGNPFSVTQSDMYTVTVTNAAGCTATNITTVIIADFTVNGSLGAGDLQKGSRMLRIGAIPTCATPKTCPGAVGVGEVHYYDLLPFTNTRNVPVCATIAINSPCGTNVFMAAFSTAFDPNNPCNNYLGDPATSFFPTFTGAMEINVPANGTLTVLVEVVPNGGTCSDYTIYVDMPRDPVAYTFNATPDPVCQNGTLNLGITSGGGGASYNWAGNGVNNTNTNTTTAVPTVTGSQTYTVTVTIPGGCASTFTESVTVNAQPSATITPSPNPVCQNSTLNLSVPSAGVGASYNWSGNGIVNTNANTTTAVPTTTGTQAYAVTVTNANGCSATSSTNVTVNAQPSATITPNPSPVCQNSTLSLSVPSAGGGASYSWSGHGVVNADTNATTAVPTATGPQVYAVTVTGANACSNTGSVNVTVNPQPSAMITASQSNVCGPALVNLSVPSAGGGASYNWSGNGVVNANSNTTTASPNSGGNQIYQVTVTNAQGCSKTGSTSIVINVCIAGRIIWKTDNTSGVKDVTVTLSGDQNATVITPLNGTYSFNINSGSSFMITPSKNLNRLNGVNAQDVWRINQHAALNPILLTNPYDWVAADVNGNNVITTLDANIIQLTLLGNVQAMAQWISSWRFVPTAHTMTTPPWGFPEKITIANAGSGLANQDFYGIKVGDVVPIYANPANASGTPMVFRVQDQFLKAGQTVSVDFTADQLADFTAFQLALRFDPSRLRLSDIQSLTALPLSKDNFGVDENGLIRILWAGTDVMALRAPSPVFRLTFTALESGGKLSDVLGLDDSVLPAHVYNSKNAESELSLRFFEVTGTNDPTLTQDRLVLYQNQPNPFEHETVIGFYLPEAAKTAFTVYDVNGRLVYRQDLNGNKGYNQLTLKDKVLPNAGLFYYRVETATASATKKMVKVE